MSKNVIITGIKSSGTPHLGNYLGTIKQSLNLAKENLAAYFIADYHALTTMHDANAMKKSITEIAAVWMAMGLDTAKSILYRQSHIPEVLELNWILSCFTKKGMMNGAHAYKAAVAKNVESNATDKDVKISMGLYCYPILMAADILILRANKVPVGIDQQQHVEIARNIASSFNREYGQIMTLPQAVINEQESIIGTDGRKMSKSYNNTIPIFCSENKLRKLIAKITTDSSGPNDPKDPDKSTLFSLYKLFATEYEEREMRGKFFEGISWKDVKDAVFEKIDSELKEKRRIYCDLIENPHHVEKVLKEGSETIREMTIPFLKEVKKTIGLS